MRLDNPNHILILLGVAAIIIEIILGAATGFDLFLIGVIFVISGGVGIFTGSISTAYILIVALSLLYMVVGRKAVKQALHIDTRKTSVDSLIGRKAVIVKQIMSDKPGQVKIDGEIWRAEGDTNLENGETVTIQSVSGVTLKVQK